MRWQSNLDPQGVKWMGVIPGDWSMAPVKRRFDVQLGKMLQNKAQGENDRTVPYAKALHVLWGKVETGDLPKMFASPSDICQYGITGGDLLVCEGGEVGRAGIVISAPDPCIIQNALHRVRSQDTGDIRFLQYVLQAVNSSGWFDVLCNRATIAHFTREKFAALQIPLPPSVEDQHIIAAFLDRKTAHIDALIAKKDRQIELLREKRAALISHAVTKGLDPTVSMKDSGIEWLGEIPAHWNVTKLNHFSRRIGDGIHATPVYVDESNYRFINGNNLVNGSISVTNSTRCVSRKEYETSKVNLDENTVLLSINGTIGNIALYNNEFVILGKSAAYIVCKKELSRKFLFYWLMSEMIRIFYDLEVTGTTIYNLSLNSVRNMPIPIPSLPEQHAIIVYLDHKITKLDTLTTKIQESINRLQEYRTALISATVTGKIDVRDEQVQRTSEVRCT